MPPAIPAIEVGVPAGVGLYARPGDQASADIDRLGLSIRTYEADFTYRDRADRIYVEKVVFPGEDIGVMPSGYELGPQGPTPDRRGAGARRRHRVFRLTIRHQGGEPVGWREGAPAARPGDV